MHHLVRTIFDLSFQCATLTIRWYLALCSLLDGLFQRNIISLNNHQKSFFCDTNNPTIDAMKHLHDTFSIHLTIFQDSLYTYNEENIHVRRRRNDWSASSIHHTSSLSRAPGIIDLLVVVWFLPHVCECGSSSTKDSLWFVLEDGPCCWESRRWSVCVCVCVWCDQPSV